MGKDNNIEKAGVVDEQQTPAKVNKENKKLVYVCSNGAEYNKKEDAEEYQKILNNDKEVTEKEVK
jgi:hypothetical protein